MSQEKEICVPPLGDVEEVDVIEVLVHAGDEVEQEAPLITLESDKATMEVPSPHSGAIKEVLVKVGDKVREGMPIVRIEVAEEGGEVPVEEESPAEIPIEPAKPAREVREVPPSSPPQPVLAREEGQASLPPVEAEKTEGGFPYASPSVRKFARTLGVNLSQVRGSGPKDRILKEDVELFVKTHLQAGGAVETGAGIPQVPEIDFAQFGPVEEKPLSRIKRRSGPHLQRAWLNAPQVTQHHDVDITDLEAFRQFLKPESESREIKLTPLSFILRVLPVALREFPVFNASLSPDGQNLVFKHYCHIGVAVATPDGLVVPVIRHVDQKGVWELGKELAEVSGRARAGKLTPDDLQGGCFSVSSLGGIGGTYFTPIVNVPEVAILGLSRARMMPVWNGDEFKPRLMLPVSLSYDHRVIDGAEGAQFVVRFGELLNDMRRLVL